MIENRRRDGNRHDAPAASPAAGKLFLQVTYLHMTGPLATAEPPPPEPGARVEHVKRPSVSFYRELYRIVGERWLWSDRLRLSDAELQGIIEDPLVEILVLFVGNQAAGYAELDLRSPGEVEIAYFGLSTPFIGRRLGSYLLRTALARAAASVPGRIWLHTCSLDHPGALAFYQRLGFVAYRSETGFINDPRVEGLLPRHVAPEHPIVEP
jgi:ribosomal protein S18 acetylase RimI-like enzyme